MRFWSAFLISDFLSKEKKSSPHTHTNYTHSESERERERERAVCVNAKCDSETDSLMVFESQILSVP